MGELLMIVYINKEKEMDFIDKFNIQDIIILENTLMIK